MGGSGSKAAAAAAGGGNGAAAGQPVPVVGPRRLNPSDVERMKRRFQRLANGAQTVSIERFQSIVELGANPFITRIFQLFDLDKDNLLTIEEFTKAIEYFGSLEDEEEQYKFAFRVYDVDDDGFISSEELFNTLRMLVGPHYTEVQLEQVVNNTINEYDADGDNRLDYEEFKQLLSNTDLGNKLQLAM